MHLALVIAIVVIAITLMVYLALTDSHGANGANGASSHGAAHSKRQHLLGPGGEKK